MKLSSQKLSELKQIIQDDFGVKLDDQFVFVIGSELIALFDHLYSYDFQQKNEQPNERN
jgi:hypothetical protein